MSHSGQSAAIRGQIIVPIAVDVNVAIKITPHQDIAAAVCGYAISIVRTATADLFSPDQIAIAVELGCITIVAAIRGKIIVPIAVDVNVALKITPHQDIAAAVCGYAISSVRTATQALHSLRGNAIPPYIWRLNVDLRKSCQLQPSCCVQFQIRKFSSPQTLNHQGFNRIGFSQIILVLAC